MKRFIALCLALAVCAVAFSKDWPRVFAHRGCHLKPYVPENSMDGVAMAARFGYPTCECDVKYTSDSVLVIMHDKTINRTMRNAADYSRIEKPVEVSRTPYAVLRDNYVLESSDTSMRRPIPLFRDWLLECRKYGIRPILHCHIYEAYELAKEILGDNWIAFSANYKLCLKVRKLSPSVLIFYSVNKKSTITPEELLPELDAIGGKVGMSSMGYYVLRKDMVDALAGRGYESQSSIFKTPYEMQAIHDGASIILSDFCWFQTQGRTPERKFRKSGRMKDGEVLAAEFEELEFSAMTIEIECVGEYELVVNGFRHYRISHGKYDLERLGFRMYRKKPRVELKAVGTGCRIKDLKIDFYRI